MNEPKLTKEDIKTVSQLESFNHSSEFVTEGQEEVPVSESFTNEKLNSEYKAELFLESLYTVKIIKDMSEDPSLHQYIFPKWIVLYQPKM